jgi:adenylate kinase
VAQAVFIDELLTKIGLSYDRVISLEVPDEVLVERLLKRLRKDDTEAVIRHRLAVYHEQTAPLISFYRDRQQLISVDGNQSMEAVTKALQAAVKP